jgi:cell division GTPase FtsZ
VSIVHARSSWDTTVVEVLFLKWKKAVKQDKWYAGQSLQDYDLVFVVGNLGGGAATGAIFMICDWMRETSTGYSSQ